jgi:iron(III) transport system substrate-binding protein
VLYSDQDRAVVEPLVQQFQQQKGMAVRVVYASASDLQSGLGLSRRLREQSGSPEADLYWACGPEAIETLRQDQALEPYKDTTLVQTAEPFQGPENAWYGLGARVRVLLYNTHLVAPNHVPKSVACLGQPTWKGRCVLADPRTNGSANYHILYLLKVLPSEDVKSLLEAMKANAVQLLPDEQAVVEAVASGKIAWGVTDSDLASAAMRAGKPVKFVVTDQETYSTVDALGRPRGSVPTVGTPLLPAPVALLKNRPHAEAALPLMDFLLSLGTATTLLQTQPTCLATHHDLTGSRKDSSFGPTIDPLNLTTIPADAGAIMAMRPQATNTLADIFH